MFKLASLLWLLVFFVSPSQCWMEPQKFRFRKGEEVKISLTEGENLTGEGWDVKINRAGKLRMISAAETVDLMPVLKKESGKSVSYVIPGEGTYLTAMESNAVNESVPAGDVEAFVEDNGLENLSLSKSSPLVMNTVSMAKLLIQSGVAGDKTFERSADLRLEIIPSKNPYLLKPGDHLRCLVLFDGKPLPHVLMKVWYRFSMTTFLQNAYTENDGSVTFPLSGKGIWMVSTTKLEASKATGVAWDRMRSTLVFGIQ